MLVKLYYVLSTDEDEGGSVVDAFGERENLVTCIMYGPLTKTKAVRRLNYLDNWSTW